MTKITKNFYLEEFLVSAGLEIEPTSEQKFCIEILCKNLLQSIRNRFGTVKITSGLRNKESYIELINRGYPASKTSDHFGWSNINPRGTGAADIMTPRADIIQVFHWIIDNKFDKFRQVIYYPGKNFIHVSNSFNLIFKMSDDIKDINRVLTKTDSGFKPYPRRPNKGKIRGENRWKTLISGLLVKMLT